MICLSMQQRDCALALSGPLTILPAVAGSAVEGDGTPLPDNPIVSVNTTSITVQSHLFMANR